MKFFLTLYVCSVLHNNCLPVTQQMHTYQQSHDTFDSCIKDGLGQSFEVFFDGSMLKRDQINASRLYPKFTCEPYTPQQAPEAVEPSEST